jgi:cupin fold WbuC family metalloprotein
MNIITATFLDTLTAEARQNPRGRRNLNLHPHDDSVAHRLFNAVEPGSYIRPHRHLDPNKDETFLLVRGRLAVLEFSDDGEVMASVVLKPGEAADISAGVWHTALSLEPGTVFFEAKAGPYRPLSTEEFPLWAPPDSTPEAVRYLAALGAQFRMG